MPIGNWQNLFFHSFMTVSFKMHSLLVLLLLLFLLPSCLCHNSSRAATAAGTDNSDSSVDKVYLRSITALVFSDTQRTRSQYGSGRSQLACKGGSAAGFWWFTEYYPHSVQCKNIGWDGASIQWDCTAALSEYVEFGPDTNVKCEPYGDEDGYIYRGSCRLEYTLNFRKFHVSFVHVGYGCVLVIVLLWCYYQTRFTFNRFLKTRHARIMAAKQAAKSQA